MQGGSRKKVTDVMPVFGGPIPCQPAAQVAGENLAGQGENLAVASTISPENPAGERKFI